MVLSASRSRGLTIFLLVGVLAVGCGSDDEPEPTGAGTGRTTEAESTGTDPSGTIDPGDDEPRTEEDEPSEEEQVEGGPGDEVPAEVPAMLEIRGDSLVPPSVRVPPFIAVVVEVRSGSGSHEVRVGRRTRTAAPGRPARFRLAGLRAEESVTVRVAGGRTALVVASAEPGP